MEQQHTLLWEKCLEFIRYNISLQQYTAWFADVKSLSYEGGALRLFVPSSYFAEQIEQRYGDLLEVAIAKVYGAGVTTYFNFNYVQGEPASGVEVRSADYSPIIHNGPGEPANPFVPAQPAKPLDSQLNPQYNFENYCTGESNRIARTIAESIADNPANKTFNPLFIFGPTGVGKTHLVQAVGIRIKERNPQARVLYITARLFQSQYTTANHKGKINEFFHFYQGIDTLIIDDVQDLAGESKRQTQNTFFHIFNQLHQNNRQIILSSDRAPSEMEGFEARLLGRFKWGAQAPLDRPDADLRRRVLVKKAEQDGLSLPADVIDYIAENVTDSIRELEGVVVSLVAHATVLNRDITLDLARPVVANAIRIRRSQINFEMVTEAVSQYYGIAPDTLFTKSRKREISDARQMVMYMAKKLAGLSLKNIGARLGRTHATVLYACRNIDERLSVESDLRRAVDEIQQSFSC